MSRKILLGVLVAALAGLAIWWWTGRPDVEVDDPGSSAAHESRSTKEHSKEVVGEPAEDADEEPVREDRSAATAEWRVAGRTMRGYGDDPFPNADVSIEMYDGYEPIGTPAQTRTAKSDAAGRFTAGFRAPSGTVTLRVEPKMPNVRKTANDRLVVIEKPAPQNLSIGIYPLDRLLTGRVVDERDRPVSSAYVMVSARGGTTPCGADGTFEVRTSSSSNVVSVQCAAPGFAVSRQRVRLPKTGDPETLTIRLQPGLTIRGRVVDGGGLPVAGAKVWTFTTTFFKQPVTGGDGEFVIDYLTPSQARHSLYARKLGYVDGSDQVDSKNPKDSYELKLKRGVRVQGIVLDPDRKPVPGAPLYIGFDPSAFDRLDAVSRDDGRFVFPGVRPGKQDLVIEVPGTAPQKIVLDVPKDGSAMPEIVVQLEAAHVVAGRALDKSGAPIAGVYVSARLHDKNDTHGGRYIGSRVRLKDDGSFRVGDLPAGKVDLEFYGTDSIRHVERGVDADRQDLAVTLRRAAKLAGTVVDASTGKPIKSFRIKFIKAGGTGYGASWHRGQQFDDAKGLWKTVHEQLEPGVEFLVEAAATGYGRTIKKMKSTLEPDPAASVFALHEGQMLRGFVFDKQSSAPVVGARVIMFSAQDPIQRHNRRDLATRLTATTDAAGEFEMRDVPLGELSLMVTHGEYPSTVDGPFEVAAGTPTVRRVFVARSAQIHGTLVDTAGKPIAGADIRLDPESGGDSQATRTDAKGAFAFTKNISPGSYRLVRSPEHSGKPFFVCKESLTVTSGEKKTIRLEPPGKCTVVGTVRVEAGDVPDSMTVILRKKQKELLYFHAPVTKGRFEARGLPAGSYGVAISWYRSGNIMSGNQDVELSVGTPATVDVLLKSGKRK